ncbi:MAG TPA: RDD family protein [Bacteroidia bacterium]|jgi:uncharacterized RDD family membrane protein YckC|nr:RDD family protein [Bacteroidia bacterium]
MISTGKRLGSMILDHIFMMLIILVVLIPEIATQITTAFKVSHDQMSSENSSMMVYEVALFFAVYLCKDSINGRSLAKRITNIQVVDNVSGLAASPLKCFVRNIFILIWPVEVIVAMINPEKRIGDRVAGTKLIPFDKTLEQPKASFVQIIISLCLAFGLMLLIIIPFRAFQSKLYGQNVKFVESSYNEQESKETEKLFADSLGNSMNADIRVYDQIQNDSLKYISIIFLFKENYFESEREYEGIKSKAIKLLLTKFPMNSFIGQAKYVFKEPGHIETRWTILDWRKQAEKKTK